ncbi:protein kinase domain-containing protein [Ditylenchus destructor]|nr:protein kinase domain-containing protein [Ditylenchus destructor]
MKSSGRNEIRSGVGCALSASQGEEMLSLSQQTSSGYERIRVVGKGSFGMAILYRRKDDDSLVILKEVNLHDLSPSERQLAMNEVSLLSRMDHPHIISYYDSFEEDGVLMIEMEYADGGTLAQFLSRQTEYIAESQVLFMFEQMISAVSYLHDNNVLHRDLKTANVFLTKDNMVKIGDFGISKRMGTQTQFQGAQTILGTPYYLSPEMCEGRSYNEKSDIWALGCCLYEMLCLQKTFDGPSLPALVTKIVNGDYEQIKTPYSNELKFLVRDMLKTDPDIRPPSARVLEIVQSHMSSSKHRTQRKKDEDRESGESDTESELDTTRRDVNGRKGNCHSTLYHFNISDVTLSAIPAVPSNIKVKQLVISENHNVMLTCDSRLYSWGDNKYGQLGHGDRKSRSNPTRIDAFDDKNVVKIAIGNTFSVFVLDQGIILACGNRRFVGNGKLNDDWLKPKIIDGLLRHDVVDLSCGNEHTVVLCESGKVFAWGNPENGRLGFEEKQLVLTPTLIEIPTRQLISNVKCGPDCTALITRSGTIIAMGSNKYNKLNLNCRMGFFANMKDNDHWEVNNVTKPTPLKPFPSRVVDVSLGTSHSGVLLENGHVHVFGRNTDGELGVGNKQKMPNCMGYKPVKALLSKACVQLICGRGFTMAATLDNELYFWGSKGIPSNTLAITIEDLELTQEFAKPNDCDRRHSDDKQASQCKSAKRGWHGPGRRSIQEPESVAVTQPTLVLRLDVARGGTQQSTCIKLSLLVCNGKFVMAVIDTSSVLINHVASSNNVEELSATQRSTRHRRRRSAPEAGSSIATWIQKELENAEYISYSKMAMGNMDPSTRSTLMAEQRLLFEIEGLKKKLQEHTTNFKGQEAQLALLQKKIQELQSLQRSTILQHPNEPPPAYANQSNNGAKPRTLKNPYFSEAKTKVCAII